MSRFIEMSPTKYEQIRLEVLDSTPIVKNGKKVVVSGGSVVGMMHALAMAEQGYEVRVYDPRTSYTRNIQWAIRQSLYDEIHTLNSSVGNDFSREVARPLSNGSVHIDENGSEKAYPVQEVRKPQSLGLPQDGDRMLREPSLMTAEAKVFEESLRDSIRKHSGISFVNESVTIEENRETPGGYKVKGLDFTPDEIVIAEGANSVNREAIGIHQKFTSDPRLQLAGEIEIPGSGRMAKKIRVENGEKLITYTMETEGSDKLWIVGDIHADRINPGEDFVPGTTSFEEEKNRLIDIEFRRLAREILADHPDIDSAKLNGPMEKLKSPSPFWLDHRVSDTAVAGNNLRLAGDAVGSATPTVGGGMQLGAVSHLERAKKMHLEFDIIDHELKKGAIDQEQAKEARRVAREEYGKGVIEDTLGWHRLGVPDMYLHLDHKTKFTPLPDGHPYSDIFNKALSRLEYELKSVDKNSLIERTNLPKDDYYYIDPEEISSPEKVQRKIQEVQDYIVKDFVREVFDISINDHIEDTARLQTHPYERMREMLPARPDASHAKVVDMRDAPSFSCSRALSKVLPL